MMIHIINIDSRAPNPIHHSSGTGPPLPSLGHFLRISAVFHCNATSAILLIFLPWWKNPLYHHPISKNGGGEHQQLFSSFSPAFSAGC